MVRGLNPGGSGMAVVILRCQGTSLLLSPLIIAFVFMFFYFLFFILSFGDVITVDFLALISCLL